MGLVTFSGGAGAGGGNMSISWLEVLDFELSFWRQ